MSELLGAFLNNPEMLSRVAGILSGLGTAGGMQKTDGAQGEKGDNGDGDEGESAVGSARNREADGNESKDGGADGGGNENGSSDGETKGFPGGLSALLANKELMSKLPDILAAFGGSVPAGAFGNMRPGSPAGPSGKPGPPVPHPGKQHVDKRTALLIALKPYLSGPRREAVDYFLKINKLGDMFGAFK